MKTQQKENSGGEPIDLVDCRHIETGRAVPKRIWFIDDIIPAGV